MEQNYSHVFYFSTQIIKQEHVGLVSSQTMSCFQHFPVQWPLRHHWEEVLNMLWYLLCKSSHIKFFSFVSIYLFFLDHSYLSLIVPKPYALNQQVMEHISDFCIFKKINHFHDTVKEQRTNQSLLDLKLVRSCWDIFFFGVYLSKGRPLTLTKGQVLVTTQGSKDAPIIWQVTSEGTTQLNTGS